MLLLGFGLAIPDLRAGVRLLLFGVVLVLPVKGVVELVILKLSLTEVQDISWAVMDSGVGGRPVEGLGGGLVASGEASSRGLRNMEIGDLDV